jgi:hypothetical protein
MAAILKLIWDHFVEERGVTWTQTPAVCAQREVGTHVPERLLCHLDLSHELLPHGVAAKAWPSTRQTVGVPVP